jgi:hypothetical protein
MIDDEIDDSMRRLVQSYNEPPATPRDAMWARIEKARSAPVPIAARSTTWLRTAVGIAAVLMLGIAIGRMTHRDARRAPPVVATGPAATSGGATAPVTESTSVAIPSAERLAAAESLPSDATNPARAERGARIRALRGGAGASPDLAAYGVRRHVPGAVGEGSDMSAYRLAVVEHMARTEVLLTSFRAQSRAGAEDAQASAQFATLARDLLRNTRLLLATRSNDDPALTRLLEDLELVLMQISQYTAEGRRGDLDAINQSLDRRNVLPKLRSTIPAGASASAGT